MVDERSKVIGIIGRAVLAKHAYGRFAYSYASLQARLYHSGNLPGYLLFEAGSSVIEKRLHPSLLMCVLASRILPNSFRIATMNDLRLGIYIYSGDGSQAEVIGRRRHLTPSPRKSPSS